MLKVNVAMKRAKRRSRDSAALLSIFVALIAGYLLIGQLFGRTDRRLDEFALGKHVATVLRPYRGDQVHCSDVTDASKCVMPAIQRDLPQKIFWFGNSQLHAINQPDNGARSAPVLLAEQFRPRNIEVLAFSQPNASLQEHRLMFEFLINQIIPDVLVLPVVFDDTREDHVRSNIRLAFDDPDVRESLSSSALGTRLMMESKDVPVSSSSSGSDFVTLQERVEHKVDLFLAKKSNIWSLRSYARGEIALKLYTTRNQLLGIDASSKRSKIPANYRRNIEAFEEILLRAAKLGATVLVYIAPLRTDVEPPYIKSEYYEFKKEIAALTYHHGERFVDLEKLVPPRHWGLKSSTDLDGEMELDFMHFQFPGHELLEQAIRLELEAVIRDF